MSKPLKIEVKPFTGFEGYPLAYSVSAPWQSGLLHEGAIRVGDSITLPVEEAAEYRVRLYLPTREVLSRTSLPAPEPSVVFDLNKELKEIQRPAGAELASFVLIPPSASCVFPPPVVLEEFFPPPNSGSTSWDDLFFPDWASGLELHRQSLADRFSKSLTLASNLPTTKFTLRPFVRFWKWSPGDTSWRLDPDLTLQQKADESDGRRVVTLGEGREGNCLEVGTPSGPNYFVYLPPGPVTVEVRLRGDLLQAGKVELTLRTHPFAYLLLNYSRAGAMTEARAVANHVLERSDQRCEANVVLILGYFHLRCLELEKVRSLLDTLSDIHDQLPDLQVINGWCRLRGDPPELLLAQKAFVTAGLHVRPPVYTEGLRLLIDGLELFCSADGIEKYPRLSEAAQRARIWGWASDWDQLITTLSGSHPDHPLPGMLPEIPLLREVLRPFDRVDL